MESIASAIDGAYAVGSCGGSDDCHGPLLVSTLTDLDLALLHLPALTKRGGPPAAASLVVVLLQHWLNIAIVPVVKALAALYVDILGEARSALLLHCNLAMLVESLWRIHHLIYVIFFVFYGTTLHGGCNRHWIPSIVGGKALRSR